MKTIKLFSSFPVQEGDLDIFLFELGDGSLVQKDWQQVIFEYINKGYKLISYFN